MDSRLLIFILLLVGIVVLIFFVGRKFKKLNINNFYFVSGGIKTGKTAISVFLVVTRYWKNCFKWFFNCIKVFVFNIFHRKNKKEYDLKPMLYSNIYLRFIRFNKFTIDILYRNVRIPNLSCCLLDEVSLLADSMLFKDAEINSNLLTFCKLWGHYSHGGTVVTNSQSGSDMHYAMRRCCSRYFYTYDTRNFILFGLVRGREMMMSDDNQYGVNSVTNSLNNDIEDEMKTLFIPARFFKMYDRYCYSIFTDHLAYYVDYKAPILRKNDSLKVDNLVTLQDFKNLDKRIKKE